jgi:hypothetical protein
MKHIIIVGLLVLCSTPTFSQDDSLIVLSPRVGRFIDKHEREYFNFLPALPDSERVYFVRHTIDGKETITISSLLGIQKSLVVDSESLRRYANLMDGREKGSLDRGEGKVASVRLRSGQVRTGHIVFGDIHGLVLEDSMQSLILYREIVSIEAGDEFGKGIAAGMSVGTLIGVARYGGGALMGEDIESDIGVFGTLMFSSGGILIGLLFEAIVAAGPGSGTLLDEGEKWDSSVVEGIQAASRFPAGTPDLKLALGQLDKD